MPKKKVDQRLTALIAEWDAHASASISPNYRDRYTQIMEAVEMLQDIGWNLKKVNRSEGGGK